MRKIKGKQAFNSLDVLYLELTADCNLDCIHCGNEGSASAGLDFRGITRLLNDFDSIGGKKLILTGGEPLLHPQFQEVLELACSHRYNTKLSTNAYLLADRHFSFVFGYPLGFRVSLDGTREAHNRIRRNPQAYDRTIDALQMISEHERQIVLRSTVMRTNAGSITDMLFELERLAEDYGLRIYSVNVWPMRMIGKADPDLMLSPQEYRDFLADLNQRTRHFHPSFRIIIGPTFGFESEFEGGPIQSNQIYKCDMLNTSLHIASNGDIYPCSFVHYKLGNIANVPIAGVFESEEALRFRQRFLDRDNHDCGSCDAYESCRAGCIAENFMALFSGNPLQRQRVKDIYCFRAGGADD